MQLLAIAAGGALGSVCRYLLATGVGQEFNGGLFPLGTLVVNGIGSFLIGLVFIVLQQHFEGHALHDILRGFLIIGLLGGFTTFSAFSLETLQLAELGLWTRAMFNIILNVVVCILAAVAGVAAGRLAA